MSSNELKALASDLFTVLLCSFWNRQEWLAFKDHVQDLAKCLLDYSEYLNEKNKRMKQHHESSVPLWQISNNLSISFTPATDLRPSSLNGVLSSTEEFQYIDVGEFCPEAHKIYKYIQKVTSGFCKPCCLLTYSAVGNVLI